MSDRFDISRDADNDLVSHARERWETEQEHHLHPVPDHDQNLHILRSPVQPAPDANQSPAQGKPFGGAGIATNVRVLHPTREGTPASARSVSASPRPAGHARIFRGDELAAQRRLRPRTGLVDVQPLHPPVRPLFPDAA